MRVMIVEDEVLIALFLENLVTEFGHEVCTVAASAAEAVARAGAIRLDVALMDIRLAEGSSGVEAARQIHQRYGLRCIFLSGNLDPATRDAVRPYKPIAFVGKPVLPIKLQQALDKAARETVVR